VKGCRVVVLPEMLKDHSSPLSYRPVSLLNPLFEAFRKYENVAKILNFWFKELSLIREDQYVFKLSKPNCNDMYHLR
jgi:hypothetical protein